MVWLVYFSILTFGNASYWEINFSFSVVREKNLNRPAVFEKLEDTRRNIITIE